MKKFIIILMLFSLNLSADYLYGGNDKCIKDYYYKQGNLNYLLSSDNSWYQVTNNNHELMIHSGFTYDANTNTCSKPRIVTYLGLDTKDYNFLIALTALLSGFLTLFFMVYISIEVAKK